MPLIFGSFNKSESIDINRYQRALHFFNPDADQAISSTGAHLFWTGVKLWSKQEQFFSSGFLHVAFAGRFYNVFEEATALERRNLVVADKQNCAEIILKGYRQYGVDYFNRIDGAFSAAVYNSTKNELVIANDILGLYPLFYSVNGDAVSFCNEYESLLLCPDVETALDDNAIAEFFAFGATLGDKTFFRHIKNMAPGTALVVNRHETKMISYGNIQSRVKPVEKAMSLMDIAFEISELVDKAVAKRITDNGNTVVDLSGGIDTRLIASSINKSVRHQIKFETLVTKPLNKNNDRDILIASEIATTAELDLHIGVYTFWEAPFGPLFFERWRNERYTHNRMKGLLGGEFLNGDCYHFLSPKLLSWINGERMGDTEMEIKDLTSYTGLPFNQLMKEDFIVRTGTHLLVPAPNRPICPRTINLRLLNAFHVFTRSFFTNIYGGSKSLWVNPFTFLTKADTPFADIDLIAFLLSVPEVFISGDKRHLIHETIFGNYKKEFNAIGTSSAMGNFETSCVKAYEKGFDPKPYRPLNYEEFAKALISDKASPVTDYISLNMKVGDLADTENELSNGILDFAAWMNYIGDIKQKKGR